MFAARLGQGPWKVNGHLDWMLQNVVHNSVNKYILGIFVD